MLSPFGPKSNTQHNPRRDRRGTAVDRDPVAGLPPMRCCSTRQIVRRVVEHNMADFTDRRLDVLKRCGPQRKSRTLDRQHHPKSSMTVPPRRLKRSTNGDNDLLDTHGSNMIAEAEAIRGVAVSQQITGGGVPGKSLGDLTRESGLRGVPSDIEVYDPPSIVIKDDHGTENSECRGDNHEHVGCGDVCGVVL
jgi:hypothetical protein